MPTLVVFIPPLSVKVFLLPSNTLSGTIWSWTMKIVYTTTGKAIPPDPFYLQSTDTQRQQALLEQLKEICLRALCVDLE